jgi:hypothetical protein
MQIKIEIDVKPEELRRFLGLPDVAGLQDDVVNFLRDKVGQVNENFNPADLIRTNLDAVRQSPAWKRVMTRVLGDDEQPPEPPVAARRKRAARKPKT